MIRRIIEIVFTRFLRFHDCLSHNKSPSECRPKTVALLTSNALIICHGTFHIFMKGKMNELRHTRVMLLTSFLSTVHSFFDEAHTSVAREKSHLTVLTLFSDFKICLFSLPFLALLMETFLWTFFFFSLPLLFINSWHNSFFYILANGTTNELFSLHKPFHFDFYFANFKGFFFDPNCVFFWSKNFHSFRTAKHKKKTLWLSCEITTYFDCCWSWTDDWSLSPLLVCSS